MTSRNESFIVLLTEGGETEKTIHRAVLGRVVKKTWTRDPRVEESAREILEQGQFTKDHQMIGEGTA